MHTLTGPFPTELWIGIIATISSPAAIWPLRAVNSAFRHIAIAAIFKLYTGETVSFNTAESTQRSPNARGPELELLFTSKCQTEPERYILRPHLSWRAIAPNGPLPMVRFTMNDMPAKPEGFRGFARLGMLFSRHRQTRQTL